MRSRGSGALGVLASVPMALNVWGERDESLSVYSRDS